MSAPSVVPRFDRWLLEPAPPQRLAALRLLVVGYCLVLLAVEWPTMWDLASLPTRQFDPVGLLWWMDAPMSPRLLHGVLVALALMTPLALAGWRWWITGPSFAALFAVVTTYNLSWGHVRHTEHLVLGHVVVLALSPAAHAYAMAPGKRAPRGRTPRRNTHDELVSDAMDARFGWPVKVMALITVVGYTVAGIAKLRYGGWDWLTGTALRNQVAFDNLRKALVGAPYSGIGGWAVGHRWLFAPTAIGAVAVELGAALALIGGRLRTWWVAASWSFHVGVVVLMAIAFPYPLCGIAYAPLLHPERAVDAIARRARR
jgi:hypothetical protein